jgi:predicted CoA-substrate-specific enzyme activase
MGVFLGIDIGTVSIEIAVLKDEQTSDKYWNTILRTNLFDQLPDDQFINKKLSPNFLVSKYQRIFGNPVLGTYNLLKQIFDIVPSDQIKGVRICGSAAGLISELLGIKTENEFRAIARGTGFLYPNVATIFEMGGQHSKYILLERDEVSGRIGIANYEKSGDCAAGTGSFLDQQASRLKFKIEDVGSIVEHVEKSAKIAGRCSVFAKSDMIHAQQKGYDPPEVLKGLCNAVSRNYKSSVVKGKKIKKPVLFIGGVSKNIGVVKAMREIFNLNENELIVSEYYAWMAAIGTAIAEKEARDKSGFPDIEKLHRSSERKYFKFPLNPTLSMKRVKLLRNRIQPYNLNHKKQKVNAYLGVDVGSVSTNLAVINDDGNMIKEIYTRTDGRPIEIVDQCFREIDKEIGERIRICGVGTTGSGRELIGELIGADSINDEITAHKTGAEFVAQTMLDKMPDTIFEIGGQDSKYISIENGVVVDFAMNEACAAGTGSFLEERAEELQISIKNQFADLALQSKAPIKLGERCTVFMEQDVASYQQRGASKENLSAGLAYSIVYNYLNRVVRGRKIGDVIFFQGGTAYNDAIASAFASVLNKEIIIPPYNGVIGAIGAALLAREKTSKLKIASKFRGFNLKNVDYSLREFTCKACSNYCNMQEFTVNNEKTYWGDQCSDKFRRKQSSEKQPVIDDLMKFRRELLFAQYDPDINGKATVGLPKGLYIYEQFPFWNTFFLELGYQVVLSDETNNKTIKDGMESAVAEPCLPIQAYHGHVKKLIEQKVDFVFIPNLINADTPFKNLNSYFCPWGQTLPFVIKNSPEIIDHKDKIVHPEIRFRNGPVAVRESLLKTFRKYGDKKIAIIKAVDKAYQAQKQFSENLLFIGEKALQTLQNKDEIGIVLIGRTYNIYDRGVTLDIGSKLRDYYGVNVIPMDFLPVDSIDISDVNNNMYWNYGRKILAAAKIVAHYPNLHIIYLTNFKCGPDSYIKHYVTKASGKPFLSLQFDGHSNDAGYITRCEAYLDSKGFLRKWYNTPDKPDNRRVQRQLVV